MSKSTNAIDRNKIIGVWEDENSTMTYATDSKWFGEWDTGIIRKGVWEIKGDTQTNH